MKLKDKLWVAIILVCISFWLFSFWLGCVTAPEKQVEPKPPTVEGIVVNVTVIPEDGYDSGVLIEFEDGRIQKLRMNNCDVFQFKKGQLNVIEYRCSSGKILSVKVKE